MTDSQRRFRALVQVSSEVLYTMSPDWTEMRQLHSDGFLAEINEPSNQWLEKYIHPDDQSYVMAAIRKAINNKSTFELEHRVKREDGTWGYTFSRAIPLLNEQGEIEEWFGAASDVTERKRAEEELRKSKMRLQRVFEISTVGILIFDMQSNFIDANDTFLRMIGYDRQALERGELRSDRVTLPEWMPRTWQAFEELKTTGRFSSYEKELIRPDGTRWWGMFTGARLGGNEAVEFVIDISKRKQAEEALRESEELSRLILENSRDGIHMLDLRTGRYAFMSPAQERLTGFTLAEIENLSIEEAAKRIHPEDVEHVEKYLAAAIAGEEPEQPMEYRWRVKSSEYRWFSDSRKALRDQQGKCIALVGVSRDITERKKNEKKLEAANKELEAFSYSVSHDLRGPLRVITGLGSLLLKHAGKLDSKESEYLQRIEAGAEKMNRLIDDMLNLSKISRQDMVMQEIDLSAMAKTVFSELEQQHPNRPVEIQVADDLTAHGDARLIGIALTNLLGNSWKYTGQTAEARVEFGSCRKNGKQVFFIRDNGAGFSMAHADRLFQPFQRLHSESEFPGTGIGLPIVQRVINRHGGEIWAESEVGKGATFYFTLG